MFSVDSIFSFFRSNSNEKPKSLKQCDDLDSFRDLYESNKDLCYEKDEFGVSVLHHHAHRGNKEIVKFLLHEKLDLGQQVTSDGYNLLHLAVASKNCTLLKFLLDFSIPYQERIVFINSVDKRGFTPLMMAGNNGEQEMVRCMLDVYLADIFVTSSDGRTVMHYACGTNRAEIVRLLLENAKEKKQLSYVFDATDKEGMTILHAAAMGKALECMKIIIEYGCIDLNPLSKASYTPIILTAKRADTACLRFLLEKKADPSIAGNFGATALHEAVQAGSEECVKILLEADSSLSHALDDDGLTALHYTITAMRKGYSDMAIEIAKLLLKYEPNCVDDVDYSGATALIKACFNLDLERIDSLIRILVENGASVDHEFDHGWSALHILWNEEKDERKSLFHFAKAHASKEYLEAFDCEKPRNIDNSKFQQKRGRWNRIPQEIRDNVLNGDPSIRGICERIRDGRSKKIVVLCGAGISTSVGIPDFRSENGIYRKDDETKNCFDRNVFMQDPNILYRGCKKLFLPHLMNPKLSQAHKFLQVLNEKNLLVRVYDQNVDGLNRALGRDLLREAHGTVVTARCRSCGLPSDSFWRHVKEDKIAHCAKCADIIRPDVVFFGEGLPNSFAESQFEDFKDCDLLLVMGTSLTVYPFASLVNMVGDLCPRMLLNREAVGAFRNLTDKSYRDVFASGDIDQNITEMVKLLGWEKEIENIRDPMPLLY